MIGKIGVKILLIVIMTMYFLATFILVMAEGRVSDWKDRG